MRRGRNLDVPNRQPERSQNLPHRHPVPDGLHPLRRPHAARLLILKAREDVRQQRRWPDRVVVCKHDDVRRHVPDPVRHLQPLFRERHGQHPDALRVDRVGELLERPEHAFLHHDDNFLGVACHPACSARRS